MCVSLANELVHTAASSLTEVFGFKPIYQFNWLKSKYFSFMRLWISLLCYFSGYQLGLALQVFLSIKSPGLK